MRRASGEPPGSDEPSGFSAVLSGATAVGAIHVSSPASAHDEAKSDTSESSDSEKVCAQNSQGNSRVGAIHVFSPASGSGAEEKKLDPDNSKQSGAKMKGQQDGRIGAIHVPAAAACPNDEVKEDTSFTSTSEKACAKKSQRDARVGAIHFFPPASRNGAEEDTADPDSSMKISAKKQGQHDTRVGAIHVPGSAAASPLEAIEDTCESNGDSKPSAEKGHLDRRVGAIHVPSPAAFTQNETEEDTSKPNGYTKLSGENVHSSARVGAIHMPPPASQNGLQEDTNLGVGKSMDNVKGSANSSTSMHDRAILYTLNEDDDEPVDNPNLCLPDKSNPQHPLTLQPPPLRRASVREVPNQPGAFSVEGSSNIESERTSEEDAAVPLTSIEIDPEDALRQQEQNNNDVGLATALPIQEEERQIARESTAVGPDQTAPDRNRRSRLLCCVVAVVIGGAILATVGAVCGSGLCASNDSGVIVPLEEETMAPIGTYHRDPMEVSRFMWQFGAAFGVDYLEQAADSAGFLVDARNEALHWILYEDPLQLEATSDHLLQRFVLALLYFHTTKDRLWTECNPSPNPSSLCHYTEGPGCDDCFQDSTEIWGHSWLSNVPECNWGGVTCSQKDKQLVELNLRFNDLNGPLPWELSKLTQLRRLNLGFNHLTGTLPTTLGMLDCDHLKLTRNKLVGTIPTELFSGSIVHDDDQPFPLDFRGRFRKLQLQGNALTGSIPTEVGNSLWGRLGLGGNLLSGSLPMELFNARHLISLDVNQNKISGTLPAMIGQLRNMQHLQLNNTALAGSLPSQIALLSNLTTFRIDHSNFGGTIPEEVYSGLQKIRDWRISNNQFSGTISTAVGMWVELWEFSIANNRFSGELPEEIGTLTNLYQVELNGNDFSTETVHDSLCALRDPAEVGPERGDFFEWQLVADCTPDANTGIPKMACPRECCTVCCDHKTQVCHAN